MPRLPCPALALLSPQLAVLHLADDPGVGLPPRAGAGSHRDRFLLHAPDHLREQLHGVNDRWLQNFIHLPDHRSRFIFDLDSTVVTTFGHQAGAEVGHNPRYRGKRSYNPLLCIETNSAYLWDAELRAGNAGTWDVSVELLDTCFANVPPDIRENRARADAGFAFNPVREALERAWVTDLPLTPAGVWHFFLPGEITRPPNRPVLRLKDSPFVEQTVDRVLARTTKLKPPQT